QLPQLPLKWRNSNAASAKSPIPPLPASPSTDNCTATPRPGNLSAASTARRNMSAWVPSRCTSEAIPSPACAPSAAKLSPGLSSCRATSEHTLERSRSPAHTATEPLQTTPTSEPTCRPILRTRSISEKPACGLSPTCHCSTNMKKQAVPELTESSLCTCARRHPTTHPHIPN
ncbi:hypothetical protein JRQ81_019985, partial [Phrynocephalus forsythii]